MYLLSNRTRRRNPDDNELQIALRLDMLQLTKIPLSEAEKELSTAFQKLIEVFKKCDAANKLKLIHPSHLVNLFNSTEDSIPKMQIMDNTYNRANYSYGVSINNFHLYWDLQKYRIEFMTKWLTENKNVYLTMIPKESVLEGMVVAAEWEVDHMYYRAVIRRVNSKKCMATVYLIDKGNEEVVEFGRLRSIPKEVAKIPRMAFRCKLSGVSETYDEEYGITNYRFIKKLKGTFTSCSIESVQGTKENSIASVQLYETSDSTGLTLNFKNVVQDDIYMEVKNGTKIFLDNHPFPSEAVHHYHFSASIKIPADKIQLEKSSVFRISYIVNPGHLYIQKATSKDITEAEKQDETVQNYYRDHYQPHLYDIKTDRVFVNRTYVSLNEKSGQWERVIVLRVDVPDGYAFVERVDFGEQCLIKISNMREIKKEFCVWPRRAYRAHLIHIRPQNGSLFWDDNSKPKFQELVKELPNDFTGIALTPKRKSYDLESTAEEISYGMLLIDMSQNRLALQAKVKDVGLADATGFLAEKPNFIFPKEEPTYKIKTTCHNEKGDYFKGDVEIQPRYYTVGSALLLYRTNLACHCQSPCRSLVRCPSLVNKRDRRVKKIARIVRYPCRYIKKDTRYSAPIPGRCTFTEMFGSYLPTVNISHIVSPGIFYVQSTMKSKQLEAMMHDIGRELNDESEWQPQENVVVAAFTINDQTNSLQWHRAYVSKLIPEVKIAKVILLDFGNQVNINFKNIQDLPKSFIKIPYFCHRAHLDFADIEPATRPQGKWSRRQTDDFKYMIQDIKKIVSNSVLFGWRVRCDRDATIQLEYYNQDVMFSFEKNTWMPENTAKRMEGIESEQLSHLMKSIGMDLQFSEHRKVERKRVSFNGLENGEDSKSNGENDLTINFPSIRLFFHPTECM